MSPEQDRIQPEGIEMTATDRIAIENAVRALRAIQNYANENPEFARIVDWAIPTPGGKTFGELAGALGATAIRYPTYGAQVRCDESRGAA